MNNIYGLNPYPYSYNEISRKKIEQEAIEISKEIDSLNFREFVTNDEIAERTYRFIKDFCQQSSNVTQLIMGAPQKSYYHTSTSTKNPLGSVIESLKEMVAKNEGFIKPFNDKKNLENSMGAVRIVEGFLSPSLIVHLPSEYIGKKLGWDAKIRLQHTFESLSLWFEQLGRLTPVNDGEQFTIRLIQNYDYSPKIVDIHFFAGAQVFAKFVPGDIFPGGFVSRGESSKGFMEFLTDKGYKESRRAFNLAGKTLSK